MQKGFGAARCCQGALIGFTYGLARADQTFRRKLGSKLISNLVLKHVIIKLLFFVSFVILNKI